MHRMSQRAGWGGAHSSDVTDPPSESEMRLLGSWPTRFRISRILKNKDPGPYCTPWLVVSGGKDDTRPGQHNNR
ncbi:hypothetical protein NECAME_00284 [Necator americanus]|uniref:Uncharacterized protein n=1 Tax=Necator americanus TaxID=51031 RepID=W2TJF7_NECAM|nr:hypothetical protein NECAME_00284 [Necator americanus]ETN81933.1 hypothetical protein NECAME_00284 [Necator americanus]